MWGNIEKRGEVICMINRRKINLFDDVYFLLLVLQFYFVFLFLRLLRLLLSVIIVWVDFFSLLLFFFTCRLVSHFFCVRRGKIGPGGRPL